MNVRVLLADDHEMFLEGMKALLEQVPDIELAGTARDGLQAVQQARLLRPDIVLMDLSLIHI